MVGFKYPLFESNPAHISAVLNALSLWRPWSLVCEWLSIRTTHFNLFYSARARALWSNLNYERSPDSIQEFHWSNLEHTTFHRMSWLNWLFLNRNQTDVVFLRTNIWVGRCSPWKEQSHEKTGSFLTVACQQCTNSAHLTRSRSRPPPSIALTKGLGATIIRLSLFTRNN